MTISLEGIELHAYHGVYPNEKREGNRFVVSVHLSMPDTTAIESDRLADTVDYQDIYTIVCREMALPSDLLEHVAGRIRKSLLEAYPSAEIHVKISKCNPPLGGIVATASVEL